LEPDLHFGEIFCRYAGAHKAVKILQQVFLTRLAEREAISPAVIPPGEDSTSDNSARVSVWPPAIPTSASRWVIIGATTPDR
jgi:hypothetical protein